MKRVGIERIILDHMILLELDTSTYKRILEYTRVVFLYHPSHQMPIAGKRRQRKTMMMVVIHQVAIK